LTHSPNFAREYTLNRWLWHALDWLYPPVCAACSTPGYRLCNDCLKKVKIINQQKVCPVCGIPQTEFRVCDECEGAPPAFTAVRSWGVYEDPLRSTIHRLKYHSDLGVSQDLAGQLSRLLSQMSWSIDLVTPVPLSAERQRQRGYNQASLLARWVSLAKKIRCETKALIRVKDTPSQVGLTGHERRRNVSGAFIAEPRVVDGKSILVIDDVATTGATMQACAIALIGAGAARVYGLTLARAGHIYLS